VSPNATYIDNRKKKKIATVDTGKMKVKEEVRIKVWAKEIEYEN
jgi:hypothetical protein